jgi:hypothetical protein
MICILGMSELALILGGGNLGRPKAFRFDRIETEPNSRSGALLSARTGFHFAGRSFSLVDV